ncbi:hypothetical protein V1477_020465 [Vespula maculifrons]|uniref:Uncharacterized protein n=2 Tax=Vespula TaxID=7451 RepID=A0A834K9M5_VESVU|nr:hypothetical protein HZH66_004919 [Vespula vulgaris]
MAHEGQHPPALENGHSSKAAGLLLAQSQAKAACWRHNRTFLTETGFFKLRPTMVQSLSSRLTSVPLSSEKRQSNDSDSLVGTSWMMVHDINNSTIVSSPSEKCHISRTMAVSAGKQLKEFLRIVEWYSLVISMPTMR